MKDFRIAVKAFIVKKGKVLLIKRRANDVHKPGTWDIPGGRLDLGEDPLTGVQREAVEEIEIDVKPIVPVDVHHFTRDDGQLITMIIFLCKMKVKDINLSEEHTEFQWVDLHGQDESAFPDWLKPVVNNVRQYLDKNQLDLL